MDGTLIVLDSDMLQPVASRRFTSAMHLFPWRCLPMAGSSLVIRVTARSPFSTRHSNRCPVRRYIHPLPAPWSSPSTARPSSFQINPGRGSRSSTRSSCSRCAGRRYRCATVHRRVQGVWRFHPMAPACSWPLAKASRCSHRRHPVACRRGLCRSVQHNRPRHDNPISLSGARAAAILRRASPAISRRRSCRHRRGEPWLIVPNIAPHSTGSRTCCAQGPRQTRARSRRSGRPAEADVERHLEHTLDRLAWLYGRGTYENLSTVAIFHAAINNEVQLAQELSEPAAAEARARGQRLVDAARRGVRLHVRGVSPVELWRGVHVEPLRPEFERRLLATETPFIRRHIAWSWCCPSRTRRPARGRGPGAVLSSIPTNCSISTAAATAPRWNPNWRGAWPLRARRPTSATPARPICRASS